MTDKKAKKIFWLVFIPIVVLLALVKVANSAIYPIENDRGYATNSTHYVVLNGTTVEATNSSSPRADSVRYDTTFTLDSTQRYVIAFVHGINGVDSNETEIFIVTPSDTTGLQTLDTMRCPARWWTPTDSVRFRKFEDGVEVFTGSWHTDNRQSYDTNVVITNSKRTKIVFEIAYTGVDTPVDWEWEFAPASLGGSVVSPTLPQTCNVYLFVVNNDGTPAEGVGVSAFITRGRVTDSSGNIYSNDPKYKKTNSSGVVYFTCVWSSYLIPESKWRFTGRAPGVGGFRKDYTVPRQAVDTLNLTE